MFKKVFEKFFQDTNAQYIASVLSIVFTEETAQMRIRDQRDPTRDGGDLSFSNYHEAEWYTSGGAFHNYKDIHIRAKNLLKMFATIALFARKFKMPEAASLLRKIREGLIEAGQGVVAPLPKGVPANGKSNNSYRMHKDVLIADISKYLFEVMGEAVTNPAEVIP